MIKGVIFDFDGTLADTVPDLETAMNNMLRRYGWRERTRDEILSFINRGVRAFVARAMPKGSYETIDDDIVNEAIAVYNEEYAKCCNDKTAPFPGVADAIASLKSEGIKLGVLSNKQDEFVKLMTEKLFPGAFDSVHGQSDLPEKPSPESAYLVASEMGVAPSECAFVGDSDVDMKTGVNSGMLPVGVLWGYRGADVLREAGASVIVSDADELVSVILGKN